MNAMAPVLRFEMTLVNVFPENPEQNRCVNAYSYADDCRVTIILPLPVVVWLSAAGNARFLH